MISSARGPRSPSLPGEGFMDVIWKGALGGLVTALIVLASKKGDVRQAKP